MLEYGKSGIYNNNRLPAEEEEKKEENTRDRSVPDGSDNKSSRNYFVVNVLFLINRCYFSEQRTGRSG